LVAVVFGNITLRKYVDKNKEKNELFMDSGVYNVKR